MVVWIAFLGCLPQPFDERGVRPKGIGDVGGTEVEAPSSDSLLPFPPPSSSHNQRGKAHFTEPSERRVPGPFSVLTQRRQVAKPKTWRSAVRVSCLSSPSFAPLRLCVSSWNLHAFNNGLRTSSNSQNRNAFAITKEHDGTCRCCFAPCEPMESAVTVHGLAGDWFILGQLMQIEGKDAARKHGPVPVSSAP